jgi:hypothetical protein
VRVRLAGGRIVPLAPESTAPEDYTAALDRVLGGT